MSSIAKRSHYQSYHKYPFANEIKLSCLNPKSARHRGNSGGQEKLFKEEGQSRQQMMICKHEQGDPSRDDNESMQTANHRTVIQDIWVQTTKEKGHKK